MVDVGANIGSCAFDLAQLGHRVYAFEFQRDNYERMRSTKKLNDFKGGIDIFNVLVSSESKPHITVASDINSKNMGAQGAREVSRSLLGVKQQVSLSAMRLDDAVNRHVNFMKLDCQGCEYAALLGAENIFQEHGVDLLYMEFSPPSMASASGKPKAVRGNFAHAPEVWHGYLGKEPQVCQWQRHDNFEQHCRCAEIHEGCTLQGNA